MHPADFVRGLLYVRTGLRILRKYPELRRYARAPIAITCAALAASFALSIAYHDELLALLWAAPAPGEGWLTALLRGLYAVARVLAFLLTFGLLSVLTVVFSTWIAAPFNDALSEAIEARETGQTPPPFSLRRLAQDLARTLRLEALKLLALALILGPLFVGSLLVPGAGQALYAGVSAFVTCAYFGLDYIDWPASRRGLGVRARVAIFFRRPLLMLGFGAAVWLCLFVPLLNLTFMPIAVAGGTRLFLDLEAEQHR
jgi:CysZ protein